MSDSRPQIPDPILREVRQRCGFGCVLCGLPLYTYEHMLGWANVHRHIADEMTLLCDQHQRERTNGLLPIDRVQEANKHPYNLREGVSKRYDLHYIGNECEIVLGSNHFTTKDRGYGTVLLPVSVDGVALLAFILGDGHLLLNLNIFDEYNHLILQIQNNQLLYSVSSWDIQFVGRNLVVREAQRKILIDITFEVPNRIVINRGRFLRNGVEILIRPEKIMIVNNGGTFSGSIVKNCPAGIVIGPHAQPIRAIVRLDKVPRYTHTSQVVDEWIGDTFSKGSAPEAD